MENELVSILIPVYNRGNIIGETIQCAIDQTYTNIEIIIVDNCSTDNTWEVLNSFVELDSRIKIFQNSENIGPVRNWKKSLDKAEGLYSKILFSDDLIGLNYIEECINLMNEDVAFVISKYKIFFKKIDDRILGSNYSKNEYSSNEYIKDILLWEKEGFSVSPGCAFFRTLDLKANLIIDVPNELNLDFARYGAGNDLLIFLLAANKYPKILIADSTCSYFRSHDGSFSISNDLELYYQFSRYYFIDQYFTRLRPRVKSKIFLISRKNKKLKPLLRIMDSNMSIDYIVKYAFSNMLKRIYN